MNDFNDYQDLANALRGTERPRETAAAKFEPKCDCWAYDPLSNDCSILTDLLCAKKGRCGFYDTPDEAARKRQEAEAKHPELYGK